MHVSDEHLTTTADGTGGVRGDAEERSPDAPAGAAAEADSSPTGLPVAGAGPMRTGSQASARTVRSVHGTRSSMSVGTVVSRRASSASTVRGGRARGVQIDFGLPPGLKQLISQLTNSKDLGLIAYLSAIPGHTLTPLKRAGGGGPIAPKPVSSSRIWPQRSPSMAPKSIMKFGRRQIMFEPSYRLDPEHPVVPGRVYNVVRRALEEGLQGAVYSEQFAVDACRIVAAFITNAVKSMDFSRYKVATAVTISERKFQGISSTLGVLWDTERDGHCSCRVLTNTFIAHAVVFMVYCD